LQHRTHPFFDTHSRPDFPPSLFPRWMNRHSQNVAAVRDPSYDPPFFIQFQHTRYFLFSFDFRNQLSQLFFQQGPSSFFSFSTCKDVRIPPPAVPMGLNQSPPSIGTSPLNFFLSFFFYTPPFGRYVGFFHSFLVFLPSPPPTPHGIELLSRPLPRIRLFPQTASKVLILVSFPHVVLYHQFVFFNLRPFFLVQFCGLSTLFFRYARARSRL